MEKQRIEIIDQLKALGMFLVILGHVPKPGHIGSLIYAFHMPFFFILSGATINYIMGGVFVSILSIVIVFIINKTKLKYYF